MPKKKPFEPNLRTPESDLNKTELCKRDSRLLREPLENDLKDFSKPDIVWEAEQIAKSHGIYLEFNRSTTGTEKEWMYMVRFSIPGGGPITPKQWAALDDLSSKYTLDPDGHPSIRLTTRQNIQFHWIKKENLADLVRSMAEQGLYSINGCGDNTRNVMGCPLSLHSDVFNGVALAKKISDFFMLPVEPFVQIFAIDPKYVRNTSEQRFQYGPQLLNRKFKIGISALHKDPETGEIIRDNCVEALTNDLAVVPVFEDSLPVKTFQIYIGGGQGERNGKPSMAALAEPLTRVSEENLLPMMDAIVKVHQEWGDRQNRHWARLKYVVKKMGLDWYRDRIREQTDIPLQDPDPDLDIGRRMLHHGWHPQPESDKLTYGLFIENGRIKDHSPNGRLKTMIREMSQKFPVNLMITPNQDLLFTDIPGESRDNFEAQLKSYGYGERGGKAYSTLRKLSGACVGLNTCRLSYTESEKFEPVLIDDLEARGWSEMTESIGVTGCERQCFRPSTKTIGIIGTGKDRYQIRLMGSEAASHQGRPIIDENGEDMYLRMVPRDNVADVVDALFRFYTTSAEKDEDMGTFHRRIGMQKIIARLKEDKATTALMEKPFNTACVID